MPKVSTRNSSLVVLVCLDSPRPEWEVNDWLLDGTGFPWAIHAILEDGLLLMPMRDLPSVGHQIGTLVPYKEGTAEAYLHRIFDYMSRVEALDLNIIRIRSGTWFESWGDNQWVADPHHDFKHDATVAPKDTVVFTDSQGIEWGPLPCDLAVAPDGWPFRGGIRSKGLTFEPIEGPGELWTIKMSPFETNIQGVGKLIQIVLELNEYGWLEMVRRNYPNGMCLIKDRSVPHAFIDVTKGEGCG